MMSPQSTTCITYLGRREARNSENGMALILCIGFMAILSILGTLVLNLTNTEMGASTRDMIAKDVFFTADRAVEYALSPQVYSQLNNEGDQADLTGNDPDGNSYADQIEGDRTDLVSGLVTYEGSGGAPSNAGKYDKMATAGKVYRYFHISVEARSTNPLITDTTFIDGQLVQAFPAVTNVPVEYASGKQDAPGGGGN